MVRTFTFSGASPFGMTPSTTISLLWLFTVAIRAIPFSSRHLQTKRNVYNEHHTWGGGEWGRDPVKTSSFLSKFYSLLALRDCGSRCDKPEGRVHTGPSFYPLSCRTPNNCVRLSLCSYTRDNTWKSGQQFKTVDPAGGGWQRGKFEGIELGGQLAGCHSPVTIRNVFHFWTETVSMVATVAAITKQQLIFVVSTMTKLAILQPKVNSSFKKDERTLGPRVAKVAWRTWALFVS